MLSRQPLAGEEVVTTGILRTEGERAELEERVGALGGRLRGDFNVATCTVLVAASDAGAKFEAAVAHGVPVVKQSWLEATFRAGSAVPKRDHLWPASAEALRRRKRARAEEAAQRHPLDEVGAEEDEDSDSRLVGVTVRLLGDAAEVVPFRFLFRSAGAWCEVEGPPSRPQPRARVSDASACEAYVLVGANEWQPWKDWWG